MADVLIVCVREDEPQAKALAEMFEAAGFSIGGAPSSDSGLRSSGAGLVVWSQASIRSRPFLDAAQRVINAEKAVVASLIEPPPPSSIGDSPVFDLSRWDGDPNDPSLDPLFFAVDRMVNSARAAVGAGSTQAPEAPAYEAPRAPPPAPRPQRPEPPAFTQRNAPPSDPLGSEAEHWRAIRDSRNPADFMDYLGRYGPDGAFAEVAELRLKQLTSSRGDARPAPAPPARPAPPPQRPAMPPRSLQRTEAPPPRRAEAPPPQRRPEPQRRVDRPSTYDRADLRDPPKSEGGALRAFILIALIGGAAVAGGLYFGGGIPDFSNSAPSEQTTDAGPIPSAPLDEPADAIDTPVGVPIENATPTRSAESAARRPTPPPAARAEPDPPTPQPTTSWAGAPAAATNTASSSNSGGPVSLSPTELASNAPGASVSIPPAPTTSPATPASTTVRPAAPAGRVTWASRPSARRIADLYPARAARDGLGGRVQLDCLVQPNQSVICTVASESPANMGFSRAALAASTSYRANPYLSDGTSSSGSRARIAVQFQPPQQP